MSLSRRARLLRLQGTSPAWATAWRARLAARPVLAALLGLLLLAEMVSGGGEDARVRALALPGQVGAMAGADVQGWTQTILARPLFNPDRRPAAIAGDAGHGLPRLSAILIAQGTESAIFDTPGQKPLVVQPGGQVAGDRVLRIDADGVVLSTATGPLTLHPRFAKGAADLPPAVAPPNSDPAAAPTAAAGPVSPITGQPEFSSRTAGPYDNE